MEPTAAPVPPPAAGEARVLVLIGAGHVFDIRRTIRDAVVAYQPDQVYVELDRDRLEGLLARDRERARGSTGGDKAGQAQPEAGFVQKRLRKYQEGIASMYGAQVGGEMLGAWDGARAVGAQVVCVDGAADDIVRKALRELTLGERLRFVGMLAWGGLKALVPGRLRGKDARAEVEGELKRYQEDPGAVLGEMADKFPTIHRVLIAERDEAMAKRMRAAFAQPGCRVAVAVLGDGHLDGIVARLGDLAPTVYRLGDVRAGRLPRGLVATGTAERIGFSVRGRVASTSGTWPGPGAEGPAGAPATMGS